MLMHTPLSQLNKVGKATGRKLARLGLKKAGDLLYYFPFRYEDYSQIVRSDQLQNGAMVTVRGKLELLANKRSWHKHMTVTEALLTDSAGSVRAVWFNQPYILKLFAPGDEIYLSGKVQADMLGAQLTNPTFEKIKSSGETTHTARLVPMYPLTSGVTQKQLRFLVSQVLPLAKDFKDWLPEEILEAEDLIPLSDAILGIHFPKDKIEMESCVKRLKFDELFLIQMQAELARRQKIEVKAPRIEFKEEEIKKFVAGLPFMLTKTQKISAWEILQDLNRSVVMNRLLSGDVGSGKTVVAAMAIYSAILNGYQSVLMAPTEILANQHYQSLVKLLGDKAPIGILTQNKAEINGVEFKSATKTGLKKEWLAELKKGKIAAVVGTHALLSEGVDFRKLGLVIVDEQHRFGVEQRRLMKEKGENAHFLSMTATPIPRSLALMLYGDLDVSIINELPPGRKKIITRLVETINRQKAYDFIRAQVKEGRQVFVVCPLIEEKVEKKKGDEMEVLNYNYPGGMPNEKKTVLNEYKKLSEQVFKDLKVGFLHGKMPARGGFALGGKGPSKDEVMAKFKNNEINILVSTSVVEVGVDIPNASVMMIEGADRFGLAQLHQFRGRVGRSAHQSYCLLFTAVNGFRILERLKYFEKEADGFKLAEKDLEMRGPGEVYGTVQSGLGNLKLAKLTDRELIKKTRDLAKEIAGKISAYPLIMQRVKEWKEVHLE